MASETQQPDAPGRRRKFRRRRKDEPQPMPHGAAGVSEFDNALNELGSQLQRTIDAASLARGLASNPITEMMLKGIIDRATASLSFVEVHTLAPKRPRRT